MRLSKQGEMMYQGKRTNEPNRQRQSRKNLLKIGEQVYFHFALKNGSSIECRGFVIRQPDQRAKVDTYKIVIAAATASSLTTTKYPASSVCGLKVTRKPDQLSTQQPAWWTPIWAEHHPQRVQEAINRARHGHNR